MEGSDGRSLRSAEDGSEAERARLSDRNLEAIFQISRAVGTPAPLADVLAIVAERAADVVGADSAGIVLIDAHSSLRLGGAYGLSRDYGAVFLTDRERLESTPVALAVDRRCLVAVADAEEDPSFRPWRYVSRREGYRAIAAAPLLLSGQPLGALVVYRRAPGRWSAQARSCLELMAEHAATAARTAQLLDGQKERLTTLARLVSGLREQMHEHAERLQAIGARVDRGDVAGARRLLGGLHEEHHATYAAVAQRVHSRTLAGLVLSEMTIARQRGIEMRIDRRSQIDRLPPGLDEADALSVVSNLLENAFDAVAGMPPSRRRVSLLMRQTADATVFRVRDWGVGLGSVPDDRLTQHGFTSKPEHAGVGLAIVRAIAEGAGGQLRCERPPVGASLSVVIPRA